MFFPSDDNFTYIGYTGFLFTDHSYLFSVLVPKIYHFFLFSHYIIYYYH